MEAGESKSAKFKKRVVFPSNRNSSGVTKTSLRRNNKQLESAIIQLRKDNEAQYNEICRLTTENLEAAQTINRFKCNPELLELTIKVKRIIDNLSTELNFAENVVLLLNLFTDKQWNIVPKNSNVNQEYKLDSKQTEPAENIPTDLMQDTPTPKQNGTETPVEGAKTIFDITVIMEKSERLDETRRSSVINIPLSPDYHRSGLVGFSEANLSIIPVQSSSKTSCVEVSSPPQSVAAKSGKLWSCLPNSSNINPEIISDKEKEATEAKRRRSTYTIPNSLQIAPQPPKNNVLQNGTNTFAVSTQKSTRSRRNFVVYDNRTSGESAELGNIDEEDANLEEKNANQKKAKLKRSLKDGENKVESKMSKKKLKTGSTETKTPFKQRDVNTMSEETKSNKNRSKHPEDCCYNPDNIGEEDEVGTFNSFKRKKNSQVEPNDPLKKITDLGNDDTTKNHVNHESKKSRDDTNQVSNKNRRPRRAATINVNYTE